MCHGSRCPYEEDGDKCRLPLGVKCWEEVQDYIADKEAEDDEE